jgi:hypothetical protein
MRHDMLDLVKNALFVLAIGFPALLSVALIMRRLVIKRTRIRYQLKTWEIILYVALIITDLCYFGIEFYFAKDPVDKGFYCFGGIFLTLCWLHALHRTLNDDDDDWFNDQWKKLKQWLKDLRTISRRRVATST